MKLDLTVWDQFVDGRSGMRMVTFVSVPQALSTGGKVGPRPALPCSECSSCIVASGLTGYPGPSSTVEL